MWCYWRQQDTLPIFPMWIPGQRKNSMISQWPLGLKPRITTQPPSREVCYVKCQYVCGNITADVSNDKRNEQWAQQLRLCSWFWYYMALNCCFSSDAWLCPCINQRKINWFNFIYCTTGFVSTSSASTIFLLLPGMKLVSTVYWVSTVHIDIWRDIWVLIAADFFEGGTE